jgi:hypothetical protein
VFYVLRSLKRRVRAARQKPIGSEDQIFFLVGQNIDKTADFSSVSPVFELGKGEVEGSLFKQSLVTNSFRDIRMQ